ncbi:DNA-binding protein [Corallococcus sp. AB030]|uniref:helix-turn-helix domain-containing protein n=1 Tax=Corallococcus TaxID=83461 RepID=UPI000EC2FBE9|nr:MULTISPECIES: helix-turn-helix domain-containing protein [Corallococcus]NRD51914.1 helix-turn-helix domain-containing protein [Corallococcus exiguus]RKI02468.1 DNA-binding protein [Corallococcus sp. AB030]
MIKPTCSASSAPDFLTVDETAALLRVNRKTLYESIRLGQVPGVVHIGRSIRLRRDALLACVPGNSGPALGEQP